MNEQRRALHAPRMVEAFEHFAGSAASATPGGCTGWRGTLLHIHIAEAASYEMEELNEATVSPVAASKAIVTLPARALTRGKPTSAR
jgi:hypothetical protein